MANKRNIGAEVIEGLEQAIAYAGGDKQGTRTTIVEVPETVNVRAVRKSLGMSQATFSATYGIAITALQEWEKGRRRPDRTTRAYLKVIEKEPEIVHRALAG